METDIDHPDVQHRRQEHAAAWPLARNALIRWAGSVQEELAVLGYGNFCVVEQSSEEVSHSIAIRGTVQGRLACLGIFVTTAPPGHSEEVAGRRRSIGRTHAHWINVIFNTYGQGFSEVFRGKEDIPMRRTPEELAQTFVKVIEDLCPRNTAHAFAKRVCQ